MRRGVTSCGPVLAGAGGWASCPTEGGGYWSAPSNSALRASAPTSAANASAAANKCKQRSLCIKDPSREVNPRQGPEGSTKSLLGRPDVPVWVQASTPARHLLCKRYNGRFVHMSGAQNRYLSQ